jgi:hypothetical protein
MKHFVIGYNCDNLSNYGFVKKGFNILKVVKGESIEQVRKDYAGRFGFKPNSENFIVREE